MKYIKKKLDDLIPYKNNPRITEETVDDVAESIRQCSYITPIVIDEKGEILAGHVRVKALRKLGEVEAKVIQVSGLTEAQKRKYRLYDNKTAEFSTWDKKKLKEALSNVDFEGYDFGQPDFSDYENVSGEQEPETVTCPCCGEVFEV